MCYVWSSGFDTTVCKADCEEFVKAFAMVSALFVTICEALESLMSFATSMNAHLELLQAISCAIEWAERQDTDWIIGLDRNYDLHFFRAPQALYGHMER